VTLVARRGVVVLHEAFGALRPGEDAPPAERDTIFPVMSITKPIAATIAMQLVEDGILGLNRPARDYVPELVGEGTEEVLVHHLLTHTAGYDDFGFFVAHAADYAEIDKLEPDELQRMLLDAIYGMALSTAPGEEMNYSATGFFLLGEVVERARGRPLAELMQERLFDPLGMKDSYLVVPESVRDRIIRRTPGLPWTAPLGPIPGIDSRINEAMPSSQGGVYSTAPDLARFSQMLLDGGSYEGTRILGRTAVSEMTRNQTLGMPVQMLGAVNRESSYGYGWFVSSDEKWKYWDGSLQSRGEFHHQGAGGSLIFIDPPKQIVAVYLSVDTAMTPDLEPLWNADLFQNIIASAVAD
jgi:CubicO group peptidase (beta-lactamase class C family)